MSCYQARSGQYTIRLRPDAIDLDIPCQQWASEFEDAVNTYIAIFITASAFFTRPSTHSSW